MCHKAVTKWRCGHIRFNDWEYCKQYFEFLEAGVNTDEAWCQPGTSHLVKVETEMCYRCGEAEPKKEQQQQQQTPSHCSGPIGGSITGGDQWNTYR